MKIYVSSVMIHDQAHALKFYTEKLGFQIKHDIPAGDYRWLTLVSPEQLDGVELLLEPDVHHAAKPFKAALKADGIPYTSFQVSNIDEEYERLKGLGVEFFLAPTEVDHVKVAILDDTCGNYIQLMQFLVPN